MQLAVVRDSAPHTVRMSELIKISRISRIDKAEQMLEGSCFCSGSRVSNESTRVSRSRLRGLEFSAKLL